MQIEQLIREFRYNGVVLADPNPAFNLSQVRDFYATTYPEIVNADIEGPEQLGAKAVYTFRRAVGTKGALPFLHVAHVHFMSSPADTFHAQPNNRRFTVLATEPADAELSALAHDLAAVLQANWMLPGDAQFIKDVDEAVREGRQHGISTAARARLVALHREYCEPKVV